MLNLGLMQKKGNKSILYRLFEDVFGMIQLLESYQ